VNLLELHVLSALRRDQNVEMRKIRRAIEWLQAHMKSRHPLIDEEMQTDGTDVFVGKYGELINASRSGQLAMKALLQAHLKRIDRDRHGVANSIVRATGHCRVARADRRDLRFMKQSAAKARRPDRLSFYVDECLGKRVPLALASEGYDIKPWFDHFPGVDDEEWLPQIGERR
jgi:hypothetical protein